MTATASSRATWTIRSERWAWRCCARRTQAPRRTRSAGGSSARSGASAWIGCPAIRGALRLILREWVAHYNGERPHSALGPGVPGPPSESARTSQAKPRCRWTPGALVRAKSVLDGLHHDHRLDSRRSRHHSSKRLKRNQRLGTRTRVCARWHVNPSQLASPIIQGFLARRKPDEGQPDV